MFFRRLSIPVHHHIVKKQSVILVESDSIDIEIVKHETNDFNIVDSILLDFSTDAWESTILYVYFLLSYFMWMVGVCVCSQRSAR